MNLRLSLRMLLVAAGLFEAFAIIPRCWRQAPAAGTIERVHTIGGDLSHWGRIYDIGLVNDRIISCGLDRTVRVWSAETGKPLQILDDVDGHVAADSTRLVTIDDKQQARVYDATVAPLAPMREFSLARDSKITAAFASDVGSELAVTYKNQPSVLVLFDFETGDEISQIEFQEEVDEYKLGFREDGRLLAVSRNEFRLMSVHDGIEIARSGPHGSFYGVARLNAPWWLVGGLMSSGLWNEETHEWQKIEIIDKGPKAVASGPQESAWLAGDGVMLQYAVSMDSPRPRVIPTTPITDITALSIEHGAKYRGRRAIGYGYRSNVLDDGHIALLDEYGKVAAPATAVDHIISVGWSQAGDLLATGSTTGEIVVYSAGDWVERKRFRAQHGGIPHLAFSPDGKLILCTGQDMAVFDWESGKSVVQTNGQFRGGTLSSPDGHLLAYVGDAGWTLTDRDTRATIAKSEPGAPVPFHPFSHGPVWLESERCYVYFADKAVCRLKLVKDEPTGKMSLELSQSSHPRLGRVLDFSPRDARVLTIDEARDPKELRVWDWKPPAMRAIPFDSQGAFRGAAFIPTRSGVAALLGRDLVVFNAEGKEPYRQQIGPHQTHESKMEFSPDGRYLAIVNGNGTCSLFKSDEW